MSEWETPGMKRLRQEDPNRVRGVYSKAEELLITLYWMMSGNADFVEKRMVEDYFGGEGKVPQPRTSQAHR